MRKLGAKVDVKAEPFSDLRELALEILVPSVEEVFNHVLDAASAAL